MLVNNPLYSSRLRPHIQPTKRIKSSLLAYQVQTTKLNATMPCLLQNVTLGCESMIRMGKIGMDRILTRQADAGPL